MGRKSQIGRNYVYISYGVSFWIQYLECQNSQKAAKGMVFERKKIANIRISDGGEKPNNTKLCLYFLRN